MTRSDEIVARIAFQILVKRYRHMMTESGAFPREVSDAELLDNLIADTHEERLTAMAAITSYVPERYWRAHGL